MTTQVTCNLLWTIDPPPKTTEQKQVEHEDQILEGYDEELQFISEVVGVPLTRQQKLKLCAFIMRCEV